LASLIENEDIKRISILQSVPKEETLTLMSD
jgi:hypothetical protein